MYQTQFSEKIPYGGFSQIRSHIIVIMSCSSLAFATTKHIQTYMFYHHSLYHTAHITIESHDYALPSRISPPLH